MRAVTQLQERTVLMQVGDRPGDGPRESRWQFRRLGGPGVLGRRTINRIAAARLPTCSLYPVPARTVPNRQRSHRRGQFCTVLRQHGR
jgi:hypothetical protein